MRAVLLSLLFITCIIPANLFAAEVALPELVGEYAIGDKVTVNVDFGHPIADLSRVGLELTGLVETSWVITESDTSSWSMKFIASFAEPDPGFWTAEAKTWITPGVVLYSFTYFSSQFGATSDFLADGRGELNFEVAPQGYTGTIVSSGPPPWGRILSARLVFDEAVSTKMVSWGGVKSLFR